MIFAVLAGKRIRTTVSGTTTDTYRNPADTVDRVVGTINTTTGNRNITTLNGD
jgi:hypothetical protein